MRRKSKQKMKAHVSRTGKLLGAYVPRPVVDALENWIEADPERDKSSFLRTAVREKLARDGIVVVEETV